MGRRPGLRRRLGRSSRRRPEGDGHIYIVQAVVGGPFKIGFSRDPEARLRELQTGSPVLLRIVDQFDGDMPTEQRLHALLEPHKSHGEWFLPTSEAISAACSVLQVARIDVLRIAFEPLLRPSKLITDAEIVTGLAPVEGRATVPAGHVARLLGVSKGAVLTAARRRGVALLSHSDAMRATWARRRA